MSLALRHTFVQYILVGTRRPSLERTGRLANHFFSRTSNRPAWPNLDEDEACPSAPRRGSPCLAGTCKSTRQQSRTRSRSLNSRHCPMPLVCFSSHRFVKVLLVYCWSVIVFHRPLLLDHDWIAKRI